MSNQEFDLGAWIGRRQAFGALSGRSLAAEAHCLRLIRDRKLYLAHSPNWPDFCDRHVGISRATADRIIQSLDEFGPTYFRLSGLTRISPETYREIAPLIADGSLNFDGQLIPIDFDCVPQ